MQTSILQQIYQRCASGETEDLVVHAALASNGIEVTAWARAGTIEDAKIRILPYSELEAIEPAGVTALVDRVIDDARKAFGLE